MALNLGTLAGQLDLDNSKLNSKLGQAEGDLKSSGGKMATIATVAGAAAGAALGAAFLESMAIEAATDKLAAQLLLTETESARVGAVAGDLFANAYGENIGQVNDALRSVISQTGDLGDISDEELSRTGAAALDLAAILSTDVTRVVQVAGQAVRTGLADNMTDAFDQIAAASAKTMPGLEDDLLDAMDEYGPNFAALGLSGEQAFGMLAAASEKGMFGIDKTGDALKEFTIRATDMSAGSVDAFNTIGLNADDMAADILAGGDTAGAAFDQIIDGLLAIEDPVAQSKSAIALFGTPLEDLSTAEIPDFLSSLDSAESSLGDVAGSADKAGDRLNENAQTGFTALARSAKEGLMSSMEPLLPVLTGLVNLLTPLAPILGPIAVAIAVVTAAQWAWNIAMAANPIGLIVIAIVALIAIVVLLVQNWDTVVAALGVAWAWIKETAVTVWTAIKDFFIELWESILEFLGDAIDWIVDLFTTFHPLGIIISNWDPIWTWVSDLWTRITNWIGDKVDAIGGFFSGMWDGITNGLKSALNGAISLINSAISGINTLISGANKVPGVNIPSVPSIPLLAEGGNITASGMAIVGENGPELLELNAGARVTPLSGDSDAGVVRLSDEDRALLADLADVKARLDIRTDRPSRAEIHQDNAMQVV